MPPEPGCLPDPGERAAAAYVAALGVMDEEGLVAVFAPRAVAHFPAESAAVVGRPGIRELIRCVFAAAEPVTVNEELVMVTG